jgi:hypothetical protein
MSIEPRGPRGGSGKAGASRAGPAAAGTLDDVDLRIELPQHRFRDQELPGERQDLARVADPCATDPETFLQFVA